jgi:SAM-dependent methyltransferase
MTVKEHYDNHLGNFYSWMCGNFDEKQREYQQFFTKNNIVPSSSKIAIDLGAGHGIQSSALAKLGFTVHAVDFNEQLLCELKNNTQNLSVCPINEDIRLVKKYKDLSPELIICVGDTIAHLDSKEETEQFIKNVYKTLVPKGKFILSFRDYETELIDDSRFIPVKSDSDKIMICFLEYFPEKLKVTDILYKNVDENWTQTISSYYKVRVTKIYIISCLENIGFKTTFIDTINRMITIIADKEYHG